MLIRLHLDFWFLEDFLFEPQMYIQSLYLLELVSLFVGMILPLLLAIAFFTVMERQITDGLKVFVKESILPKSSNIIIFIFSPIFTFGLAMAGWLVIVGAENSMLSDFNLKCKQIYKLASLQKNRIVNAAIASAIETQKPALTYLEATGSWVYEHPIATIALVSGIVILGGVGYTYVFYPHLLGYISAAGGLTTQQLLDEELKKNKILQS